MHKSLLEERYQVEAVNMNSFSQRRNTSPFICNAFFGGLSKISQNSLLPVNFSEMT
jgi:hypothetical protein